MPAEVNIPPPMSDTKTITAQDVEHIARLAKIQLTPEEVATFAGQFSGILDHFSMLSEVNTDDIPETAQVTGLTNVTRPDVVQPFENQKRLLESSPFEVENNSIKIPKIM